jgi:preprotein translocase subunit SecA
MHSVERGLVLEQLDSAWKTHLLSMDNLRSGVGLRGYAQEDPKIVYKREGMKEFRLMWAALVASLVWVASGLYLILR